MKESFKMIGVLTAIAGLAGLGLALMNDATRQDIDDNARRFLLEAINQVVPDAQRPDPCQTYKPGFDNEPDRDAVCVDGTRVFRARKGRKVVAIAMETVGENAYSGTISLLTGIRMTDGMLLGVKVLAHAETPGLGSLITECNLLPAQIVGQTPESIRWSVRKDGGDVDQLTGATISSRSMLDAITKAQTIWRNHKKEILDGKAMKPDGECHAR